MMNVAAYEQRLIAAVAKRIGTEVSRVTLVRWNVEKRTGANIPVFGVPAHLIDAARSNGLTVEVN